jgi:hypothetical protein
MRSLSDPAVIVALCCSKKVMALTLNLSKALQTVNKDLTSAVDSVRFVQKTLTSWRTEAGDNPVWTDAQYGPFSNAQSLAESLRIPLSMPRLQLRQAHRTNVPAENPSQYYQREIWFPYLDAVIQAMDSHFQKH